MDVAAHIDSFNAAVTSGDWAQFVANFEPDARMEFVGPPVGPFVGREAIAQAYAADPPEATLELAGPQETADGELVVPYRWVGTGATGTMRFKTGASGGIARLVITFD